MNRADPRRNPSYQPPPGIHPIWGRARRYPHGDTFQPLGATQGPDWFRYTGATINPGP